MSDSVSTAGLYVKPGMPYPLGATLHANGANFALFSEHATAVWLCLYDAEQPHIETARFQLHARTYHVWHIQLDGVRAGQLYGYRVDGPYKPQQGFWFNPNKLLLDPYAKAITAPVQPQQSWLPYDAHSWDKNRYLTYSSEDSGPSMPKGIVIDSGFDWEDDRPPGIPLQQTILYEAHLKGFTNRHPNLNEPVRGTYAALGSAPCLAYLKQLGITAIQLMPVQQFTDYSYWGYNTISFFAPHNGYTSAGTNGEQVAAFKQMVKNLHRAGIEVILDIVYNHTAEGNQFGPVITFKGIDNPTYFLLNPKHKAEFLNYTGTGNTFSAVHPRALQVIMDSLRYWVSEMHVDGFRFDMATILAYGLDNDSETAFLPTVLQDPLLANIKLIAEAWDMRTYGVGTFPSGWSEWNDKYRDTIRRFWRGDALAPGEVVTRLLGSPDLYVPNDRMPANSINYITAHDGFTLQDLVSYNRKYNEANGENNTDGPNENYSFNGGFEGQTDDAAVNAFRERQKRNFLLTLFFSQGTPMLLMGDEYGRTQQGNNNTYNQDNELSWMNWQWTERQQAQFEFVRGLLRLRQALPLFRYASFFDNTEVAILNPNGKPLSRAAMRKTSTRSFGLLLNALAGESFFWILNPTAKSVSFRLPTIEHQEGKWHLLVDTATGVIRSDRPALPAQDTFAVTAHASVVLQWF